MHSRALLSIDYQSLNSRSSQCSLYVVFYKITPVLNQRLLGLICAKNLVLNDFVINLLERTYEYIRFSESRSSDSSNCD